MAAFEQRGDKWRVLIRRRGFPTMSKTFGRKDDAERWATMIERDIDTRGINSTAELKQHTVNALIEKFEEEILPARGSRSFEQKRINIFKRQRWVQLTLADDLPFHLRKFRDDRLLINKPVTVNRDLAILSTIFDYAIKEWSVPLAANPVKQIKRAVMTDSGERDQTWTNEQLDAFLKELGWSFDKAPETAKEWLGWAMVLARKTGLRRANVLGMPVERINLEKRVIQFKAGEVKNREDYDCPLTAEARDHIKRLIDLTKAKAGPLFPYSGTQMGLVFHRARETMALTQPWVEDYVFHSLRHTFTTEMSEKIPDKMTLMRITGRRSLKSLVRYYRPKAEDLAKLMD